MSKELQTIPGLRDDIQVLRLRIEELTERIDKLQRPTAPDEPRRDETQAPPSPEPESETAAAIAPLSPPPTMVSFTGGRDDAAQSRR